MYAENLKQFNKIYRIWIAHTEQQIDTIIPLLLDTISGTALQAYGTAQI